MANRQLLPNSISPINGDVESAPGDPDVHVVAIQGTPVLNQQPQAGQLLIYDQPSNQYIPGDPIVSGTDSVGTPPSRPPVQVAGIDDGNLVRELRLDSSGTVVSTNLEKLLMLLISEQKKTNLILRDLSGNDPIGDQDGDFESI